MNYYKHHLGDYAKDTAGLSMMEHGAYRLLIDAYYSSEAPIEHQEAYTIAKAANPAERRAVDRVLSKYFHRDGDLWRHNRIGREVGEYQRKAAINAENGKHGGRPKGNPEITESVSDGLSETNPNKTLASNHKPITNTKTKSLARATRLPEGWELPDDWRAWTRTAKPNWPEPWIQHTADDFRDYWLAAVKGTKLDWQATWRKWVRNANDPKGSAPAAKPWANAK